MVGPGEYLPEFTLECNRGIWNYNPNDACSYGCGTNNTNASECPMVLDGWPARTLDGPNPIGQTCSGSPATCQYGNVSCCGEDHPEFTLECNRGVWNYNNSRFHTGRWRDFQSTSVQWDLGHPTFWRASHPTPLGIQMRWCYWSHSHRSKHRLGCNSRCPGCIQE